MYIWMWLRPDVLVSVKGVIIIYAVFKMAFKQGNWSAIIF